MDRVHLFSLKVNYPATSTLPLLVHPMHPHTANFTSACAMCYPFTFIPNQSESGLQDGSKVKLQFRICGVLSLIQVSLSHYLETVHPHEFHIMSKYTTSLPSMNTVKDRRGDTTVAQRVAVSFPENSFSI